VLSFWVVNEDWLRGQKASLFPQEEDLWSAAWTGYLFRSRAYPDVFHFLVGDYERAVAALDPNDPSESDEIARTLAQHIGMLYLSGTINLRTPLLEAFFERASGPIRGTLHWACLRAIDDHPEKVSEPHWTRLRELWEERISRPVQADSQKELHWFGWFFSLLPDAAEWGLRHLVTVVRRGIDIGHRDVLARIAAAARTYPAEAFSCVRALADADIDSRDIRSWGNDVEQVLSAAHAAGDATLRAEVEVFVNNLAARGVLTFRHILAES
jgi:hypothetical protein